MPGRQRDDQVAMNRCQRAPRHDQTAIRGLRKCRDGALDLGRVAHVERAGKDQRDLAKFCDEKSPSATDLPIDRIGQAVQPTPTQRAALDDLKDASVKAAEGLKVSCPAYQMLTPTGRIEAMEKRLDATLGAVKTVQPALAKFYNSLSDEQKARFNSLRSASRPAG
jgi:LTXXQ motif family protein